MLSKLSMTDSQLDSISPSGTWSSAPPAAGAAAVVSSGLEENQRKKKARRRSAKVNTRVRIHCDLCEGLTHFDMIVERCF